MVQVKVEPTRVPRGRGPRTTSSATRTCPAAPSCWGPSAPSSWTPAPAAPAPTTPVGQFACELIDAVPGSEDAAPSIRLLVQALREGVTAATAMDANAALAAQVADEVQALAEQCRGVRPLETAPVLGELATIDRLAAKTG